MRPVVVINVVGLSPRMIGPETPHLAQLSKDGAEKLLTSLGGLSKAPGNADNP